MILLPSKEYEIDFFLSGGKRHWYGYPRAFVMNGEIFINQDAFYLDRRDYELLRAHETGHVNAPEHEITPLEQVIGADHTLTGVMCPWGLVRWLTA